MAVPTKDQTIYLDNIRYDLKQGQGYCQSNSLKLQVSGMEWIIRQAGMQPVKTWIGDQGRMALHLIKA